VSGDIAGISFSFAWHPSLVRHVLMMRVRGTESEELNEGMSHSLDKALTKPTILSSLLDLELDIIHLSIDEPVGMDAQRYTVSCISCLHGWNVAEAAIACGRGCGRDRGACLGACAPPCVHCTRTAAR